MDSVLVLGYLCDFYVQWMPLILLFEGSETPLETIFSEKRCRNPKIFKIPREKFLGNLHLQGQCLWSTGGFSSSKRTKRVTKKHKDPGKSCEHIILDSELNSNRNSP